MKKLRSLFITKESIELTLKKAMVSTNGLLGISTKATTRQISDISMVRCTGMMGASTKESGLMVFSTAMGRCTLLMGMLKKASLRMESLRSKVMRIPSRTT